MFISQEELVFGKYMPKLTVLQICIIIGITE